MLDRKQRLRRGALTAVGMATAVVVLAGCGGDRPRQRAERAAPGRARRADKILDLFTPFFWIAVVIGVGVVGGDDLRRAALPREAGRGARARCRCTATPCSRSAGRSSRSLILAVMAVPTVATIFDLAKKPDGPRRRAHHGRRPAVVLAVRVHRRGQQFVTANEMHIPVGRPVSMRRSRRPHDGVIHSFWVPELNGKKDVVPGRTQFLKIEADKPGTYLGPVRRVLRALARRHADARDRADARPTTRRGSQRSSSRSTPRQRRSSTTTLEHEVGLRDVPLASSRRRRPATVGPNLTHARRPQHVRGRHLRR